MMRLMCFMSSAWKMITSSMRLRNSGRKWRCSSSSTCRCISASCCGDCADFWKSKMYCAPRNFCFPLLPVLEEISPLWVIVKILLRTMMLPALPPK